MPLSTPQVRDLAKKGALARVEEIKAELSSIYQSFPELRGASSRVAEMRNSAAAGKAPRRKSRISAAGRERIRQAQLKRWAAVRAKRR